MFSNLFRLGRDAELRSTAKGDQVCDLALAYEYGRKGDDGKYPTQWIKATLWGKQAEALSPYLKKGGQISADLDDVHVKTREHEGKTYNDLVARVVNLKFAGSKAAAEAAPPRPAPPARPATSSARQNDDFENDSIPF